MFRFATLLGLVLCAACERDIVQLGVPKTCGSALVAAADGVVDDTSPLRLDGGAGFLPADSAAPIYFEALLNTDIDTGSIGVASSDASLLAESLVLDGERAGVVVGVAADPVAEGIAFRHNGTWETHSDPDAAVYAHALAAQGAAIHPAAALSSTSSLTFILDTFRDAAPIGHESVPAACAAAIEASNAASE